MNIYKNCLKRALIDINTLVAETHNEVDRIYQKLNKLERIQKDLMHIVADVEADETEQDKYSNEKEIEMKMEHLENQKFKYGEPASLEETIADDVLRAAGFKEDK